MKTTAIYKVIRFLSEQQMKKHGFDETTECYQSLESKNKSDYFDIENSEKLIKRTKTGKYLIVS